MSKETTASIDSVKRFFWRYHLTMFTVIAVSGIAIAILSLIGVVARSSDTDNSGTSETSNFDEQTIERVKQLNDVPNYTFTLPSNQRNNPFAE